MHMSRMLNGISKVNEMNFYHIISFSSRSDFSAISSALKYDCCPTLYPFVLYTIRIRRRFLYYFTTIVGNKLNKI
jgi:hypothetical protein